MVMMMMMMMYKISWLEADFLCHSEHIGTVGESGDNPV